MHSGNILAESDGGILSKKNYILHDGVEIFCLYFFSFMNELYML